jgi:isopentenyldiphosphate isomerase
MELLDIVNENGIPTGETVEREEAHRLGIRHRTSHVWILRRHHGKLQVLLQKRSEEKDSYPGCYDISSAGHIPAGVDFVPSALRELKEELGVEADAGELHYCGQRSFTFKTVFRGKPFYDKQVSNIYILWLDQKAEDFTLQQEEVSEVKWFDFDDCVYKVTHGQIPNCIYLDELDLVAQGAEKE